MKLNVIPTVSVNDVTFGMEREKVRSFFGDAVEFYKFDDDENTTDDFGFCHVFYDSDNKCEAIEIFNEAEVYVNDKLFFPNDFGVAKEIVNDLEEDDEGMISYSTSIGIYAPDGEMESVLFGKKGYYDEEE